MIKAFHDELLSGEFIFDPLISQVGELLLFSLPLFAFSFAFFGQVFNFKEVFHHVLFECILIHSEAKRFLLFYEVQLES